MPSPQPGLEYTNRFQNNSQISVRQGNYTKMDSNRPDGPYGNDMAATPTIPSRKIQTQE